MTVAGPGATLVERPGVALAAAAVMEEHGHPDAEAVRQDADLGRLVLGKMERRTGA